MNPTTIYSTMLSDSEGTSVFSTKIVVYQKPNLHNLLDKLIYFHQKGTIFLKILFILTKFFENRKNSMYIKILTFLG